MCVCLYTSDPPDDTAKCCSTVNFHINNQIGMNSVSSERKFPQSLTGAMSSYRTGWPLPSFTFYTVSMVATLKRNQMQPGQYRLHIQHYSIHNNIMSFNGFFTAAFKKLFVQNKVNLMKPITPIHILCAHKLIVS